MTKWYANQLTVKLTGTVTAGFPYPDVEIILYNEKTTPAVEIARKTFVQVAPGTSVDFSHTITVLGEYLLRGVMLIKNPLVPEGVRVESAQLDVGVGQVPKGGIAVA